MGIMAASRATASHRGGRFAVLRIGYVSGIFNEVILGQVEEFAESDRSGRAYRTGQLRPEFVHGSGGLRYLRGFVLYRCNCSLIGLWVWHFGRYDDRSEERRVGKGR